MICSFFGHRNASNEIEKELKPAIVDLIENHNVYSFYVGNQGNFDSLVHRALKELSLQYPISYHVVLAYMPEKLNEFDSLDYSDTIVFDGIESVPKRFAIDHRNRWMIKQSDYVITYVAYDVGSGASKYKQYAERLGRKVINLRIQTDS